MGWDAVVGDVAGSVLSGAFNAHQADKNRDWQEAMSNTQYQRAAADMEAAGLNRILALGGPAGTPGGAQATMDAPKLGTTLTNARVANAQISNTNADTAKKGAETLYVQKQEELTAKQVLKADYEMANLAADTTLKGAQYSLAMSGVQLNEVQKAKLYEEIKNAIVERGVMQADIDLKRATANNQTQSAATQVSARAVNESIVELNRAKTATEKQNEREQEAQADVQQTATAIIRALGPVVNDSADRLKGVVEQTLRDGFDKLDKMKAATERSLGKTIKKLNGE